MARLAAAARLRCPRCLRGPVWRGLFAMHDNCPACGFRFEREPGYWTGAMLGSYLLGVPVLAVLVLLAWRVLALQLEWALAVASAAFIALAPFIWRYSRVLWLHLDWLVDPALRRGE